MQDILTPSERADASFKGELKRRKAGKVFFSASQLYFHRGESHQGDPKEFCGNEYSLEQMSRIKSQRLRTGACVSTNTGHPQNMN